MKSRNVIISLILVLALLVFIFIRIRLEPKKKPTFNRNPSRIEYSGFALCRMECYSINANSIIPIFRNGNIQSRKRKETCTTFTVNTLTKKGMNIFMVVDQCGTVAKVIDCYIENRQAPCECANIENRPMSYLKSKN
jgi:hypothetical protein